MTSVRTRLALLLLLLLPACHREAVPPAPRPEAGFRVVSFNIRAGTDMAGRPSLDRLAALLDSLGPDVVFLQEVDRNTRRSGRTDLLAELADRLGMHPAFARSLYFDDGEYGTGLLSRSPIQSVETRPLPVDVPDELAEMHYEPRGLLHARIRVPDGDLHLVGTHLDYHGRPDFRHPQLLELMAYVAREIPRDAPVVLGGDFNAEPGSAEIQALTLPFMDAWTACGSGAGDTFPADRPDRRIDYVFLRGARCGAATVVDTQVSDHRPVVVDLHLPARATPD
jgi:endonuclease/exonuclease/phosphatase family metal-dependent hydrolase